MSHDIFISYSRKNLDEVRTIKEELEELGFDCWMDLSGIPSGTESFIDTIIPAIEGTRLCLLFFMTTESQASEYALKEIGFAKNYVKKRVVLVRINDDAMEKRFSLTTNWPTSSTGEKESKRENYFGTWASGKKKAKRSGRRGRGPQAPMKRMRPRLPQLARLIKKTNTQFPSQPFQPLRREVFPPRSVISALLTNWGKGWHKIGNRPCLGMRRR